ncbi:MAG: hypothetical protein ACR2QK_16345, partial [Acidimicrobiales bacterium]
MAVAGIRNRDQAWQLTLAAIGLSVVLVAAGLFALRGNGQASTEASGVTVGDDRLASHLVAGPATPNDGRSEGPIGFDRDSTTTGPDPSTTDKPGSTRPEDETTTTVDSTTEKPSTTTEASTTEKPTSTRPATTTDQPTTTQP